MSITSVTEVASASAARKWQPLAVAIDVETRLATAAVPAALTEASLNGALATACPTCGTVVLQVATLGPGLSSGAAAPRTVGPLAVLAVLALWRLAL